MSKHRPDLFTHTVNHLRTGAAQELSDELAKLVEAVRTTSKQGTLTLVLKVKPEGEGIYGIEEEIKSKLPQLPRGKSLLWGTPDGNLVTSDPNQGSFELKTVADSEPEQSEPLRQVGS
ncbi:hypothetical protein [Marinobacterium stanieri]|uniref:hypothetical protein n=1 Tax=Marinobacterium stanieri TaxID=49186 RepID=UPI000255A5DA|nr:hypothetical protein [Marinobacterium stanieri]